MSGMPHSTDWLLIYEIAEDTLFLYLTRTGSHSELFERQTNTHTARIFHSDNVRFSISFSSSQILFNTKIFPLPNESYPRNTAASNHQSR